MRNLPSPNDIRIFVTVPYQLPCLRQLLDHRQLSHLCELFPWKNEDPVEKKKTLVEKLQTLVEHKKALVEKHQALVEKNQAFCKEKAHFLKEKDHPVKEKVNLVKKEANLLTEISDLYEKTTEFQEDWANNRVIFEEEKLRLRGWARSNLHQAQMLSMPQEKLEHMKRFAEWEPERKTGEGDRE